MECIHCGKPYTEHRRLLAHEYVCALEREADKRFPKPLPELNRAIVMSNAPWNRRDGV